MKRLHIMTVLSLLFSFMITVSSDSWGSSPARQPAFAISPSSLQRKSIQRSLNHLRGGQASSEDDDRDEAKAMEKENEQVAVNNIQSSTEMKAENMEISAYTEYRTKGKELHDQGSFIEAAASFRQAADTLLSAVSSDEEKITTGGSFEDLMTCKLHEALCYLKAEQFDKAQEACTYVIEWETTEQLPDSIAPALRARAFHRRAKAKLESNQTEAALEDARAAAFLGDRKAVALYGKLMRGSSSSSLSTAESPDPFSSSILDSLFSQSAGSMPDFSGTSGSPSPSLESMFPAGLFGSSPMGSSDLGGSLAKSVLSSLSKRIEDESTQASICQYLQSTSGTQLQQMASMAGISLGESHATKIANFCKSVTPRLIQKLVRNFKRLMYVVRFIRKVIKVMNKYRNVLILFCIAAWSKSALLRPFPISKRQQRLQAKLQTKK